MGWATHYIAKLREGETVQFRPRGESMRGKIPGLINIQVGINTAQMADASDVVMIVDFEDEQALAVYETHPVHEQVKPIVGPLRDERRVVEYTV